MVVKAYINILVGLTLNRLVQNQARSSLIHCASIILLAKSRSLKYKESRFHTKLTLVFKRIQASGETQQQAFIVTISEGDLVPSHCTDSVPDCARSPSLIKEYTLKSIFVRTSKLIPPPSYRVDGMEPLPRVFVLLRRIEVILN